MAERIRDIVSEGLTFEYFNERLRAGWIPAAVEWVKPATQEAPLEPVPPPYGFQVAASHRGLEPNPEEMNVLLVMLEQIVRDRRFTQIADELNDRRLRTRDGERWTSSRVFDLLPQLIDMGPALTKSEEWARRRSEIRQPSVSA